MMENDLLMRAREARDAAYAPYSSYKVGAAILAESGVIYTGCNIENASYGATLCAERVAAAKAVAAGERRFKALAVVADSPEPPAPCGLCRQFLAEFSRDMLVVMANLSGERRSATLDALLPGAFTRHDLAYASPKIGGSGTAGPSEATAR